MHKAVVWFWGKGIQIQTTELFAVVR